MTMKLCTPIIGGPLTNLSPAVHLAQCEPGATVEVRSLTRPGEILISQHASAPDGWFALDPGRSLVAGDRLVALQRGSVGASAETVPALALTVGAAPTSGLGAVDIVGRLWGCGRSVMLEGAVPGATAEVVWDGVVHGTGIAYGMRARFGLDAGLPTTKKIKVQQRIGTLVGPALSRDVQALPFPAGTKLPAPEVHVPIRECETGVFVEKVFEGSEVVLTRGSGRVDRSPFDLSSLTFNLSAPLEAADGWMTARQEFLNCERFGEESDPISIGPAESLPTPIVGPICAGSVRLRIDNLVPGAEVEITVGADVYKPIVSSTSGNEFDVDPVPAGTITVQQFLCGAASAVVTATVDPQPAQLPLPIVVPPLMSCSRSVDVESLHPGAVVQVCASNPTTGAVWPISDQHVATGGSMTVDVTPFLREGEDVFVKECACAMAILESGSVRVVPRTPITDPIIVPPVTRLDAFVNVHNTTRDAIVEVLRKRADGSWEIIGTQRANGTLTHVPLTIVDLATGQLLRVRQRICATQTDGDATVTVVKPPPQRPILQTPPDGKEIARNTALTMSWTDPGAAGDQKADNFTISVFHGGAKILESTTTSATATLPATDTASFSTSFAWSVVAANGTGSTSSTTFSFHTPKAPKPAIQAVQDADKIKVTGSGFIPAHQVVIHIQVEFSELAGSPGIPVQVVDNRSGDALATSKNDGTLDYAFQPASVLPMLTVPKSGAPYTSPPYPGAKVTLTGRNAAPVDATLGSTDPSDEVSFTWILVPTK